MGQARWFDDWEQVVSFAEALWRGGEFPETEAIFYFLGKPWKWDDEFTAWVRAGRPEAFTPREDGDEDADDDDEEAVA